MLCLLRPPPPHIKFWCDYKLRRRWMTAGWHIVQCLILCHRWSRAPHDRATPLVQKLYWLRHLQSQLYTFPWSFQRCWSQRRPSRRCMLKLRLMWPPPKVSFHDYCKYLLPLSIVVILTLDAQIFIMMVMPKLTFAR
jgi:hypothetical protein